MAKTLTVRELRRYLTTQSPEQLVEDLVGLFTTFESVKDYYTVRLQGPQNSALLTRTKASIKNEFLPARGIGHGRLSVARRAVMDFQKVVTAPVSVIDVMLYYVEIGVAYTRQYGDIDAAFYTSMERMYASAIERIVQHGLQDTFAARCAAVVHATEHIGWGFHDMVSHLYQTYFER